MAETKDQPVFTGLTNLAAEQLGARTLSCSDDFFAEKENLIKPGRGIFISDKYTDRGKWMDGWESRRKRVPGHDWCTIKLATTGVIKGIDIDTNFFLGNHPPFASVDAAFINDRLSADYPDTEKIKWTTILEKSKLDPGSQNFFPISDGNVYSHIRLNIFPDGGVARFKVYGDVFKDWSTHNKNEIFDLAAAINGGKSIACNDMFFSHMGNLIMPGRGINMGDGWETKRNRTAGNKDWVIVKLCCKGTIEKVLVDTCHFKGNFPDSCLIEGTIVKENTPVESAEWKTILPQTKLRADAEHFFENVENSGPFTHARLTIFPDGGISRMRLFGKIAD